MHRRKRVQERSLLYRKEDPRCMGRQGERVLSAADGGDEGIQTVGIDCHYEILVTLLCSICIQKEG
jgi:hypothetical protein